MGNAIEIKHVSQHYKNKQVLRDINLVVPENSILGLIGENGAGKTTLMKAMLGLVQISSGDILIHGSSIKQINALQKVSFLLEPRYYSYLSPYEMLKNLLITSNQYKYSSRQDIIVLLCQLELDSVAKKNINTFSFGMKQRVALAMAMIRKPSILILDEPFVGLDVQGVQLFNTVINELVVSKQCTVILSSHQLNEIQELSSEIAYIDGGMLSVYDSISNLVVTNYWFTFERAITTIPDALVELCKEIFLENEHVLFVSSTSDFIFRKVSEIFSDNRIVDIRKEKSGLHTLFAKGGEK